MNENMMQELVIENEKLKQDNEKLWNIIHVQNETIDRLWSNVSGCPK